MSLVTCYARLRIRCDCSRHVEVPYPPPSQLMLKLKPRRASLPEPPDRAPVNEVRYFDLTDWGSTGSGSWAEYEERA